MHIKYIKYLIDRLINTRKIIYHACGGSEKLKDFPAFSRKLSSLSTFLWGSKKNTPLSHYTPYPITGRLNTPPNHPPCHPFTATYENWIFKPRRGNKNGVVFGPYFTGSSQPLPFPPPVPVIWAGGRAGSCPTLPLPCLHGNLWFSLWHYPGDFSLDRTDRLSPVIWNYRMEEPLQRLSMFFNVS